MKAKMQAIDSIISMCEDAIARPYKAKRMAAKPVAEVVIEKEEENEEEGEKSEGKEDSLDKKQKLSSMLDKMDEEDLIRLYEKLEG